MPEVKVARNAQGKLVNQYGYEIIGSDVGELGASNELDLGEQGFDQDAHEDETGHDEARSPWTFGQESQEDAEVGIGEQNNALAGETSQAESVQEAPSLDQAAEKAADNLGITSVVTPTTSGGGGGLAGAAAAVGAGIGMMAAVEKNRGEKAPEQARVESAKSEQSFAPELKTNEQKPEEKSNSDDEGEKTEAKPEDVDVELTRESLRFVFGVFNELKLDPTLPEYQNLINRVVKEINAHPEIKDASARREEIIKYLAVGMYRDVMEEAGLAEVIDLEKAKGEDIFKLLHDGVWQKTLAHEKQEALSNMDGSEATGQAFVELVLAVSRVEGHAIVKGSAEWNKLGEAYGKMVQQQEGMLQDKLNRRLRVLVGLQDKFTVLKNFGQDLQNQPTTDKEEAFISEYLDSYKSPEANEGETGAMDSTQPSEPTPQAA